MRIVKRFMRQIALALAIALLVPMLTPAAKVHAAEEVINSFTVEMGENAYLEYEETDSVRTAVYYKDGVVIQKSVYDLETGEILCYDLSQNIGNSQSRTFDMRQQNVVTYHIDDFKKTKEEVVEEDVANVASVANARGLDQNLVYDEGPSYTFLTSKTFTFDGENFYRVLYGNKGGREYIEDYWFFEAKVLISVVAAALGEKYKKVAVWIDGIKDGLLSLVEDLEVTDTMYELYWNYRYVQHTPTYLTFDCSLEFVYCRKKLLKANGNECSWENVYEKTQIEIDLEREEILESPGRYY